MKQLTKTLILTITIVVLVIIVIALVQLYGQSKIQEQCSYLDPIIIDILAFIAAFFLVIEGFYKIVKNKKDNLKNQATRVVRICFGFSIITLHTIQVLYKVLF